jgi:hypothetical protein
MKSLIKLMILIILLIPISTTDAEDSQLSNDSIRAIEYIKLAQPGPEHDILAELEGKWNIEIKMWTNPGVEPLIMSAVAENKMILGGRFMQSVSLGDYMGHTMESISIFGYDRRSDKFTVVGFDNQGTYWVTASGNWKEQDKVISLYGEDNDDYWEFTQKYYFDIEFINKNYYLWSVIFVDEQMSQGQESFKMMELHYKRAE